MIGTSNEPSISSSEHPTCEFPDYTKYLTNINAPTHTSKRG